MPSLHAETLTVDDISSTLRGKMYDLYSRYFEATDRDRFERDLSQKTHTLFLYDESSALRGFSAPVADRNALSVSPALGCLVDSGRAPSLSAYDRLLALPSVDLRIPGNSERRGELCWSGTGLARDQRESDWRFSY